jgi:hypothetical protein
MEPTGFAAFDRLLGLARSAREALGIALSGRLSTESVDLLTRDVLPHLELVETGARLSVRTGRLSPAGNRALLGRGGSLAGARAGDDLPWVPGDPLRHPIVPDGAALAAAGQARIILSLVPRLPPELSSWPGPGSYLDLRGPSDGVELLERVDELRAVVSRAAGSGRLPPSDPTRRTFAFFETATWLAVAGPRGFAGLRTR